MTAREWWLRTDPPELRGWVAAVCLLVTFSIIALGIRAGTAWGAYEPPALYDQPAHGEQIIKKQSSDSKVSDDVSRWYMQLVGGQTGLLVAPQYQLSSVKVADAKQLEKVPNNNYLFVQLDILMRPRFASVTSLAEQQGCEEISGSSTNNMTCVFELEPKQNEYHVLQVMTYSDYWSMADPPKPKPTAPVLNGKNGYRVSTEKLEVTYDAGKTWVAVPDGVQRVLGDMNASTELWLEPSSYVITPQFTAFVGTERNSDGDGDDAELIYSWDSGKTWLTSRFGRGINAPTFISVVGDRIGVAYSFDAALTARGYVMVASTLTQLRADPQHAWQKIPQYTQYPTDLALAGWLNDTTVFVGKTDTLYMSADTGATWQKIAVPQEPGLEKKLGFYPFDTPTRMWQENGKYYLAVGQGSDADYARDGKIMEAVFSYNASDNSFTFVKEQPEPAPTSAG